MAGEWTRKTVGTMADSISETHSFEKERLIFLNTSDILYGKVLHRYYSAANNFPGQAKKSIRKGDILFSEIRPANGRYAYIDFDADDYVVSTKLMVIRAKNQVLPKYMYHFLTSEQVTGWLQHLAESRSGTFPQITFDQVASLEMDLPPKAIQEAIVEFVDTLDDKIELNRKMNETLEAMARAIFKSWFVNFDPVRAKCRGGFQTRPYGGWPQHILALFPDSFQDSELGEIPEGWKLSNIGEEVTVVGGSTPRTEEPSYWEDGNIHWVTPKDLAPLASPVLLDTERKITKKGLEQISSGLLPKGTVLLSSRAPIGYLAIAEISVAINQGFIAMICDKCLTNLFMLYWTHQNMETIKGMANGTTFLEISKRNFRPIPMIVPPSDIMQVFSKKVGPLYEKIVCNLRQSRTLAAIRDALLPKLLSGEIRVQDAEKFVEVTL